MINALKLVSVNRGYDPRDFTLVAFGGGGGMHAVALATKLGIRKVAIPRAADVFSALGHAHERPAARLLRHRLTSLNAENAAAARRAARGDDGRLSTSSRARASARRVRFVRFGNLRYENQEHSVEVQLPTARPTRPPSRRSPTFHRLVRARVHVPPGRAGRVRGRARGRHRRGRQARADTTAGDGRSLSDALKGRRAIDYATEGMHEAAIYAGELLGPA